MSKVLTAMDGACKTRTRVALLSNPKSQASLAQLPRIRAFCADHPDIFHYEVEDSGQVAEAMKSIARMRPKVLAINGCDGTVQAARTALHDGESTEEAPLVVVLASGKLESLQQVVEQTRSGTLRS